MLSVTIGEPACARVCRLRQPGYCLVTGAGWRGCSIASINVNHQSASQLLSRGRNGKKKIANNTYIKSSANDSIVVQLHDTEIITILPDNVFVLNSGGWQTVTTKARINEFSPARIIQKNGLWLINGIPFQDGIRVDASGNPIGAADNSVEIKKRKKNLDKKIKKYIDGFADDAIENGLKRPSSGDCLGCQFATKENPHPMGLDHILSHLEESYYVPSLLFNAIVARGYINPALIYQMIELDIKRADAMDLKRQLTAYFRKLKPQLLKEITA